MGYVYFTDEQKERANTVDLKDFLERQGERLIRSGREWRLTSDHSITVRGNRWFDHGPEERGGLAIDFVRYYYGDSFPDAVSRLLGGEQGQEYRQSRQQQEEPRKPFVLPPASPDMRRAFAYLLKERLLDRDIVSVFVKEKLIYESLEPTKDGGKQYHNAIFVGYDPQGTVRHGHKKGIYTMGKNYRGNLESSNPSYSFHWKGNSSIIYVFEAPIDMLSYISLHKKDWKIHSYVALCGVAPQALYQMLKDYPKLQEVVLCLDHDIPGIEAAERIKKGLFESGYRNVKIELSQWKDWNEDIKALHGREAMPPEEQPPPFMEEEKGLKMA
ncbi:DUF3991 domain-containing protein [bacterium 1XD21-13]|nr:DUF3991 domain-containing protein [bacterium 1XD21-13]